MIIIRIALTLNEYETLARSIVKNEDLSTFDKKRDTVEQWISREVHRMVDERKVNGING